MPKVGMLSGAAQARVQAKVVTSPVPDGRLRVIGSGKPLERGIRERMEGFFGADFSRVRVHEGPAAQAVGALAFTLGETLHFAPGLYDPTTREGVELLGHELMHVVQQRDGRVSNPYGQGVAIVQDPGLEAEADAMGRRAAEVIWSGAGVGQTRMAGRTWTRSSEHGGLKRLGSPVTVMPHHASQTPPSLGDGAAQPMLATFATLAALAWGTAYMRDHLFGSSELPRRRHPRNDDMVDEVARDYTKEKGLIVQFRSRTRIVCLFDEILTVSYDLSNASFDIGEITRPEGVRYHASDILEFALRKIEDENNNGPLPLGSIGGAGIINRGTAWIANFPGVQALSWLVAGTLSVDVARQTPLGKMIEHFLADYHPQLFMRSVVIKSGPSSNARNAIVTLGQ